VNFTQLDLDLAVVKAKESNKDILLIFSMDNCAFCRILERDLPTFNTDNYVVCIVDTTHDNRIAKSFGIIIYPTSLIVSVNGEQKIVDSNIGYSQKTYKLWLQKNDIKKLNK
jgi:hypothetical protein